jgi:hypothetical protein
MAEQTWRTVNESGDKRVVVTKELPGDHWLDVLTAAGCRVEICTETRMLGGGRHCRGDRQPV